MKKELFDSNPILKLSFDFSLMVIDYCESLEDSRKYVLAKQLLRSGTSIGANCMEAQNAESKADFIHKMSKKLIDKSEEINKVLGKILSTAKRKNPLSYLMSYFIF